MASVARLGLIAFAALCIGTAASQAEQGPAEVKLDQQGHGWLLQDAKGMTLYTYSKDQDPTKSACLGPCAQQWPPLIAPDDAKADGDWSLATRDDGKKQWVFRGKPLYRYSSDVSPKDSYGDGQQNSWYVALKPIATPPGLSNSRTLVGYVLSSSKEMTLYYNDKDKDGKSACDDKCARTWTPVEMPWMASPINGDWTRYTRADGVLQWAYKGKPLYTYAGDVAPSEANGDGKDKVWHAVQLQPPAPVPAWVKLSESDAGPLYTNSQGKTLYQHQGRNRGGRFSAESAHEVEAPQDWSPVLAADTDQPLGNWSIVKNSEGKRQWAYKGLMLFTCNWDKNPGDLRGIRSVDRSWITIMQSGKRMPGTGS